MDIELKGANTFDQKTQNVEASKYLDSIFSGKKIERVLLINPPDADSSLFNFQTAKRGRYTNYPPYGLAVIAANLSKRNVKSKIINLNSDLLKEVNKFESSESFEFDNIWKSNLKRAINEFKPDLIGITCMFTMTHLSFKHVVTEIAKYEIPIVAGGVHLSNDTQRVLDDVPEINIAITREGELAFNALIDYVNKKNDISSLAQMVINRPEGRLIYHNELIPDSEEISLIPEYGDLDFQENAQYGTVGAFYCFKPKEAKFSTVLSNRGCRARCTFCSVRNFNGLGVRQRSVESVVDELEHLQNDFGISHIMWLDDDLLRNHKRTLSLFNEMVRRNLKLTWDATNGVIAASCTDEIIHAAADSGCIAINIGMESGNPQILKEIKKPGNVDTFLKAAEVFKKHEQIFACVLLIVGLPGESLSMIQDTINVSRQMDLDWYRIAVLQPLPNTPIYDSMVEQGLIEDVGNKETRFMGGAYGKQAEIERGSRLATKSFEEAFSSIDLNQVPAPDQINDIWFYMNYHLNFHRLFTEERPVKIGQQLQNLTALSDIISPENGFALYFSAYLNYKLTGFIDPALVYRLESQLEKSPFWIDRFNAFGLSLKDIQTQNFKNKHIPRLLPGGIAIGTTA